LGFVLDAIKASKDEGDASAKAAPEPVSQPVRAKKAKKASAGREGMSQSLRRRMMMVMMMMMMMMMMSSRILNFRQ
jgi:ABC-type Na+ efflux pump permease subunit